MILAFSVNKKQKSFFTKIKDKVNCDIKVVESSNILSISLKAFKFINKADFSKPIKLRIDDFYAKYNFFMPKFILKSFYQINAIFCFIRYFSIVDESIDKVLVWNGFMFRQAIMLEVAKLYKIKPIYFETGFLPNRFVIDTKGVNFYNSVPRQKEFFLNYYNELPLPDNLIPRQPRNAKKFSNLKKEKLPDNYIFVPFQVDYDTQILLFSKWIKNMEQLFFVMKEVAEKLNINVVFKEHPSSKKEYPNLHKIVQKNKYLSFANAYPTQELIQKSKAIITVNSSVGIESLLFKKKVILLGDAFYNIDGIVKKANNKLELEDILHNLKSWKIDENLVVNFLKYLYWEYLFSNNLDENDDKIKAILCE